MSNGFFKRLTTKRKREEIFPEEILIDSVASSHFDTSQFEGRIERRLESTRLIAVLVCFMFLIGAYSVRAASLQVKDGDMFRERSENNKLDSSTLWAERGVIYDRNGTQIAWNEKTDSEISERRYSELPGLNHILGFVRYPKKDKNGYYYEDATVGVSGVESVYDELLGGKNGRQLIENSVRGELVSESIIEAPQNGGELKLTIDAEVQSKLHEAIKNLADKAGFVGGGGVIIDSYTGEIIALTSFPEFGREEKTEDNGSNAFLNRVTQGLYTPGSIVKPFIAIAALAEGNITPSTQVLSARTIKIPNRYNPSNPTIFHDWKGFGMLDVRGALAQSPNSFFFAAGGGYGNVKGIGITKIEKYMNAFGIGGEVGIEGFSKADSVVPNPKWKRENFDGDDWRLGDTFLTSIGQYGFQVTPLHMVRAIAAIANDGYLVSPTLRATQTKSGKKVDKDIPEWAYEVVREGMLGAVEYGTAKSIKTEGVKIAAKTGTAEIGINKEHVNSWVVGFFPYNTRRYTFAVVMEKAPRSNVYGATLAIKELLTWMQVEKPEYLGITE